ncbi:unnamed protein product [Paramecium sonneborni]|uniref:Uncharacterized protein n=1 Tax=Paramecium sonneborni TaxID=65129 RepID=A0A8S1R4M0_9CILI|nr:unnamed protein product [Paramecium sonneborni]
MILEMEKFRQKNDIDLNENLEDKSYNCWMDQGFRLCIKQSQQSQVTIVMELKSFILIKKKQLLIILSLNVFIQRPQHLLGGFSGYMTKEKTEKALGKEENKKLALILGDPMTNKLTRKDLEQVQIILMSFEMRQVNHFNLNCL